MLAAAVAVTAAPAVAAAVVPVVAAPVVPLLQRAVAAMVRAVAVPVVAVAPRAAAHALAARHLHAAAPAAAPVAEAAATKAAIATTTRNPHARMPTWARTWAMPTQAIATPAMQAAALAASQIPCAPAWTAWAAAVAVAVVAIVATTVEVAAMAEARVVLVAGATGLVGRAVLAALLAADPSVAKNTAPTGIAPGEALPPEVHALYALGRRMPDITHPRLHLHAVDFAALGAQPAVPGLPHVDDVYITLGTTIAAAGSQQAFRAVDHDAVIATARTAMAAGTTRCGVVTAMGADANSRIFYNRIKGEVEQALKSLGFDTLVIARPSLLLGERRALGQAARPAESLSIKAFKLLDPLIPASYRARPGADVARALVHAVQTRPSGLHVLSGHALQVF